MDVWIPCVIMQGDEMAFTTWHCAVACIWMFESPLYSIEGDDMAFDPWHCVIARILESFLRSIQGNNMTCIWMFESPLFSIEGDDVAFDSWHCAVACVISFYASFRCMRPNMPLLPERHYVYMNADKWNAYFAWYTNLEQENSLYNGFSIDKISLFKTQR